MKLGVATGCFYRLDMSQEKRIQRIQSLDVEGIELTFSSMADLDSIDVKRIKYLVSEFNFVTVHSPLKQDFTERAQVERVQEFRRRIGAETVVYHPDKVRNPDLLEGFEISIENMQRSKNFDREDLAEFIQPQHNVVVDTVHANTWESVGKYPNETRTLLERYRDRISHLHTSVNGPREEHEPFDRHPERASQLTEITKGRKVILESKLESPEQINQEVKIFRQKTSH